MIFTDRDIIIETLNRSLTRIQSDSRILSFWTNGARPVQLSGQNLSDGDFELIFKLRNGNGDPEYLLRRVQSDKFKSVLAFAKA